VGYYVGMMVSLFFLTQALTVLHWSRLSDHVGRKPVTLVGLFGLSISMYCFGLSRTFWGLTTSRCLNGALNGNIGVMKSMIAEITDSTNIAQAYAYMPIAWSSGSTLGPIIGGSLSRPAERFPHLFGTSEFLKKYPYFLPCAIPATFTAIAWVVTLLFMKETVQNPVSWSTLFGFGKRKGDLDDKIISDINNPVYPGCGQDKPLCLKKLLSSRVLIAGGNYATLSLVDIAFRAILPVFFSTSTSLGGLGLSPSTIGNVLSVMGVLNGVCQVFFFAKVHNYLGSKKTFVWGTMTAFPVMAAFPVMSCFAKHYGVGKAVWAVVAFQVVMSVGMGMAYGAVFIFIAVASPNRASLGATNGICQMIVSVMRAVGPAATNSIFSLTLEKGYLGGYLVYYFLLSLVGFALMAASLLPRKLWTQSQ